MVHHLILPPSKVVIRVLDHKQCVCSGGAGSQRARVDQGIISGQVVSAGPRERVREGCSLTEVRSCLIIRALSGREHERGTGPTQMKCPN
jgi:hypothetical protein